MNYDFDYPIKNSHLNDWLDEGDFEVYQDDDGYMFLEVDIYGQPIQIMFIEDTMDELYPFKLVSVTIMNKVVQ